MICEKILGKRSEPAFAGKEVDYVNIEWHEAFKKLHKKVTHGGREVGIRMDNKILTRGLKQDDVLYMDENLLIAVNIPPDEAIVISVSEDHSGMIAKVCYEIGNKHAALFRGSHEMELITPYNEPVLQLLRKLHGVDARRDMVKFDFDKAISSSVNAHTH